MLISLALKKQSGQQTGLNLDFLIFKKHFEMFKTIRSKNLILVSTERVIEETGFKSIRERKQF